MVKRYDGGDIYVQSVRYALDLARSLARSKSALYATGQKHRERKRQTRERGEQAGCLLDRSLQCEIGDLVTLEKSMPINYFSSRHIPYMTLM